MRSLLCLAAMLALTGVTQAHHFAGFRAGFYGGGFAAQPFYGYSALVVPSVPLVQVPVVAAPVVQPVAAPVVQPAPVVQAVAAPPAVAPVVAAVAAPSYAYGAVSAVAVAPVVVRHRAFLGFGHRAAVVVRAPVVVRRPAVVVRTRAVRVRH